MPVLPRWHGHRFLFYSKEIGEPPHVHVLKDRRQPKVCLNDLGVACNVSFAAHEVNVFLSVVHEHTETFLEAWNGYFGH